MSAKKQNEQLTLNDKIKFDNKGGAILGVLEGPVADFIHPTRNGRHYSEELWENVMKNPLVQEQFKNGGIVGELDHPADRDDICTEKVAIIMPEPPVKKDGQYVGKFNILDTPCGRIVHTLAKAGFKLGVSSRGNGDVDDYTDEVDPSTYEFTCFDVVLLPAVESARMNLVTESLDTKKKVNYKKLLKEDIEKSSDDDKKVMNETLKNIGIQLEESADETKKCVICGKEYIGYGNNAEPAAEGRCCDECNWTVVIPERLKQLGLKEGFKLSIKGPNDSDFREPNEKGDEEHIILDKDILDKMDHYDGKPIEWNKDGWSCRILKEEKEEAELQPVKKDILEQETLDDVELENQQSCYVDDDKLVELLHAFLDREGLELDGEGKEEEHFIELYHEIVCPDVINQPEEVVDIDNEVFDNEEEVEDNESDELLEQLQKALKENTTLKEELKSLQAEKAVSGAKVSKLNEELNTFKSVAASAGKKVLEIKSLETKADSLLKENASLKEDVERGNRNAELQESRISRLNEAKTNLEKRLVEAESNNKKFKESLESVSNNSNKKLTEANNTITKAKKLIEQYKKLAHSNANRYIEVKARGLGISKNEILNRLNESYTLDDVDTLCEELKDYSLNISSLPFAFDKPGNARVRIREDHSRDPLKDVDSRFDDTVDDYLLDLAGLRK